MASALQPLGRKRANVPRGWKTGQKTVLFLAYMFPPLGGGGVQRSLKFVKYLPDAGWNPLVLTVRPISYYVYDPPLLDEVPTSVEVFRTHSLDPLRLSALALGDAQYQAGGSRSRHSIFTEASLWVRAYRQLRRLVFFPDAQLGWVPFAFQKGLELIHTRGASVIYSPAAPYSSAVTAYLLSKATGLPYVVDFRDGWTDDAYHSPPSALHKRAHRFLERIVVTNASAVCVYGDWLGTQLANRYPESADRIREITNGFDPADLKIAEPVLKPSRKRRIVYSGSLYSHHRAVFQTVLKAIKDLPDRFRDELEMVVVGQTYPEAVKDIEDAGLDSVVQLMGYVPHSVALGYLLSCDASLLLIRKGDVASVTGKVFELLMARRPILALAELKGEGARILRAAGAADHLHAPDDATELGKSLMTLLSGELRELDASRVAQFSRVSQAAALAQILECVAHGRPVSSQLGVLATP